MKNAKKCSHNLFESQTMNDLFGLFLFCFVLDGTHDLMNLFPYLLIELHFIQMVMFQSNPI